MEIIAPTQSASPQILQLLLRERIGIPRGLCVGEKESVTLSQGLELTAQKAGKGGAHSGVLIMEITEKVSAVFSEVLLIGWESIIISLIAGNRYDKARWLTILYNTRICYLPHLESYLDHSPDCAY